MKCFFFPPPSPCKSFPQHPKKKKSTHCNDDREEFPFVQNPPAKCLENCKGETSLPTLPAPTHTHTHTKEEKHLAHVVAFFFFLFFQMTPFWKEEEEEEEEEEKKNPLFKNPSRWGETNREFLRTSHAKKKTTVTFFFFSEVSIRAPCSSEFPGPRRVLLLLPQGRTSCSSCPSW